MYSHGGDVYSNNIELDFSVNVNPYKLPSDVMDTMVQALHSVDRYPDYCGIALKDKLSKILGVDKAHIALVAGASEAFLAISHCFNTKVGNLFYPGFFGYEYALSAVDAKINRINIDDLMGESFDEIQLEAGLVFIANPNNPTGKCLPKNVLLKLIDKAKCSDCIVVLDECFLPLSTHFDESLITSVDNYDNLIIVRSFTKTFGIPGIRLGYVIANPKTILEIEKHLPEWNISSPAMAAGLSCLDHIDELSEVRKNTVEQANILQKALEKNGFEVFDTDVNFILFKGPKTLMESLLAKKILIRDCSNFFGLEEGYFRIAVKTPEENERLIEALDTL